MLTPSAHGSTTTHCTSRSPSDTTPAARSFPVLLARRSSSSAVRSPIPGFRLFDSAPLPRSSCSGYRPTTFGPSSGSFPSTRPDIDPRTVAVDPAARARATHSPSPPFSFHRALPAVEFEPKRSWFIVPSVSPVCASWHVVPQPPPPFENEPSVVERPQHR